MKKGTLIVLGAFAVLLGLVLATREPQVSVGVHKLELPKVDPAQITALELTGARNITLRKEASGWVVLDPSKPEVSFKADAGTVNTALEALRDAKQPDFVTDRAEKLAEYELDDAKGLKIKAVPTSGPAVELVLGKAAKSGGLYVRKPGSNDVFVHSGRLGWTLRREVKDWRNHRILSLKAEDLSQLVLKAKEGGSVTLKAGTNPGEWSVAEGTPVPAGFRLSTPLVQQLAQNFVSLHAQDFLEGDAASSAMRELSAAHDSVEAHFKDGKKVVLHLGPAPEAKESAAPVAARVEGDAQVYQLSQFTASQLRKQLADLRDLNLFRFDSQKVSRLKIQSGSQTVTVAKEGESWKVVEPRKLPDGFEFDPAQVGLQLSWLQGLTGARLIEGTVPDAKTGLASPTALVEVTVQGEPVHTLKLGKEAPTEADAPKELYARSTIDAFTYAVPERVRSRFALGLELFKRPPPPPPSFAGAGQTKGLESLPPELRRQLEAQLRAGQ